MNIDEEEIVALTQRLVRLDTSNPPGNEEVAARLLGEYLAAEAIEVQYVEVEPNRTILMARLPGRERRGALLFSGHLDVVPALEEGWTYDPFSATRIDGRLIGRGAADMKGGLAAMAVAMLTLKREGLEPVSDLMLVASVGEERGMVGARHLAASGLLRDCAFLVVGEPTGLDVCPTQRGGLGFRLIVHGRGAHSSMPELGVSAISFLARAITALETHHFPHEEHPLLAAPTLNVGQIEGGVAPNIVAERCSGRMLMRLGAGQDPDEVEAEVRRVLDDLIHRSGLQVRYELDVIGKGKAMATPLDHPLARAVTAAAWEACGVECRVRGFTGGTEAAFLCRAYPLPMVIFGPGKLEQAHAVDEYVDIAELSRAARAYTLIARKLL